MVEDEKIKVYCINCKYCLHSLCCTHPLNEVKRDTPYKPIVTRYYSIDDKNKNNDCDWYEKKNISFFKKLFKWC